MELRSVLLAGVTIWDRPRQQDLISVPLCTKTASNDDNPCFKNEDGAISYCHPGAWPDHGTYGFKQAADWQNLGDLAKFSWVQLIQQEALQRSRSDHHTSETKEIRNQTQISFV